MGESVTRPFRRGVLTGVMASCVISLLCFTKTAETQSEVDLGAPSTPGSSSSESLSNTDDRPCSFRGFFWDHEDIWLIDACTECECTNGTTTCIIIKCYRPKCPDPVVIDGACCPLCPYTMEFYDLRTSFPRGQQITEGKTNHKFKFEPSVEVFKPRTTRRIRGENMWRLDAWVSRNKDGSGPMYSYRENIFTGKQRATGFRKSRSVYNPDRGLYWAFTKVKYTFNASEGLCEDFRFFCIKFNVTDAPRPKFNLSFTYTVSEGRNLRQIKCLRLGKCEVDSGWSDWSDWTACSVSCGGGMQERQRECNNPAQQRRGQDCRGISQQGRRCGTDPCRVSSGWSAWSDWTECSVSCGGGQKSRERQCNEPGSRNGERNCRGDARKTRRCNTDPCADNKEDAETQ